jgi:hypothetical protein
MEVDSAPAAFDVLPFCDRSLIDALVDDTNRRHELSHFINERSTLPFKKMLSAGETPF